MQTTYLCRSAVIEGCLWEDCGRPSANTIGKLLLIDIVILISSGLTNRPIPWINDEEFVSKMRLACTILLIGLYLSIVQFTGSVYGSFAATGFQGIYGTFTLSKVSC